ncbi:GumC family protein [Altererythrobacter sp. GH1-8]|uniref:GumC family protein n=1 Tax=Altererythrobacter sp. GH1-8 TaxID=3349333 RepID=UPI00374CCA56
MTEEQSLDRSFRRGLPTRQSDRFYDDLAYDEFVNGDEFEPSISLFDLLNILWARRLWLIIAALAGLLFGVAYSLSQTPLYRSTAIVELNPPTVPILSNSGSAEELVAPATDWQFLETQVGIMRSRALAERVVQDLNLVAEVDQAEGAEPSVEALAGSIAGGLTVKPSADSRLVEFSYVSDDPRDSARFVNGFASSFIQLTLDRKYEATTAARDFLEERIAAVRQDVNDAERKLVDYAKANGIVLLTGEDTSGEAGTSSLTGNSLASLNAALANAQQKRISAEQRYRQAGSISEVNASTAQLRQEKAILEAELREKSTYLQADFPEVVRLRNRVSELERQIARETSLSAAALRAEYQAALAEENSLRSRVEQLSSNALDEREDSIQYNILKRELDTNRTLYDALLSRYNEVGVAAGIGTAQAAIVDTGKVPGAPFSPNTLRNSLLGLLLGLGLGGGLAILYERFTNTIKTKEDMNEKLRLSALGIIPVKQKADELLDKLHDPQSEIYEAYAGLRTTLEFSTRDGFPKSLLVTSANPEEGKSTTSYSLAVQLSDAGKKVLLIDADMRKPSFVVEEQSDIGLVRLLTSMEQAKKHVLTTANKNLFLLPSGPIPPNPATIIRTRRLIQILEELDQYFDVVILDAPPTLGFADAQLLGSACGGALFTVESGKTRTSAALAALNQLHLAGVSVLGGVLTKAKASTFNYSYSYRYYQSALEKGPRRSELVTGLLENSDSSDIWHKADL